MLKRVLSIIITVFLVLSLAFCVGCGKNETTTKKTGENANVMDNEDMLFYDIPEELKGSTVQFATWIDHTKTESAKVISDFQELTDIKVTLVNVPEGQYPVKVAALIAADQAPDMLVKNEHLAQMFGLTMPLENVKSVDLSSSFWNKEIIEKGMLDGKHYFLAGANDVWSIPTGVCYYNKSIFTENGLKTPSEYVEENDWNMDTFYTCLQQCRKAVPKTDASAWYVPDIINTMYDAALIDYSPESGKFVNNIQTDKKQNLIKCWQYFIKLMDESLISTTFSGDTNQFVQGKCALLLSGSYGLRLHGWFTAMDIDDIGFTYLPKLNASDENYPVMTGTRAYCISKGSKNPEAAGYFIRYYCNGNHYDIDEVYKNKEAETFIEDMKKMQKLRGFDCEYSVAATMLDNPNYLTKPLFESSAAQLNTNLSSLSNTVDGCIEKANALLKDAAEQNK